MKIKKFNEQERTKLEDIWLANTGKNISQEEFSAMIQFAEFHVKAALKAAHRNMQLPEEDLDYTLDSYPLANIK